MTKTNPYSHFYLYSKGWYLKGTNTLEDLKILAEEYSGTHNATEKDVFQILMEIVYSEIKTEWQFLKFSLDFHSCGVWEAALNVLNAVSTGDIGRLPMKKPNPNILPMNMESIISSNDPSYNFVSE